MIRQIMINWRLTEPGEMGDADMRGLGNLQAMFRNLSITWDFVRNANFLATS
jgi:hypothetical protein